MDMSRRPFEKTVIVAESCKFAGIGCSHPDPSRKQRVLSSSRRVTGCRRERR